jgi:hypothetical protein
LVERLNSCALLFEGHPQVALYLKAEPEVWFRMKASEMRRTVSAEIAALPFHALDS